MKRVLVTGGDGLLAHALKEIAPRDLELVFVRHADFDLTRGESMAKRLAELRPAVVINTAAYNLVDHCEVERDLSWAVNAAGPQNLGALCVSAGIQLVHYGTDYVFDGEKKSPYLESDPPNPLNHYAAGKLFGEQAVLQTSTRHIVLRTSWIFGWHSTQTKTFVHTVLRAARENRPLKSTTDQISVPTHAADLAVWTLELIRAGVGGLFHAVNDESVSRYDWTRVILDEAVNAGLLASAPPVEPVTTAYFNPTMRRPAYTVLSNEKLAELLGHEAGSWRPGLKKMLAQEAPR